MQYFDKGFAPLGGGLEMDINFHKRFDFSWFWVFFFKAAVFRQ